MQLRWPALVVCSSIARFLILRSFRSHSPCPVRKVPTEAAFLRHLLEFVMSGPASEALLAVIAPAPRPEGADRSSLSPSPSRIRWEPTCLRGPSRRHCPGFPSEGADQSGLSPSPSRIRYERTCLKFVENRPASDASLAGIAPDNPPEGADQSGLFPSPSRIRWEPTCLRCPSRRHCPG